MQSNRILEKTLETPLDWREIKPVNPKGNQSWIFIRRTDAEAEAPILWPPDAKSWLFASGGHSIGASALAPVLPRNIQCCFPLGLTGLISLLSKGLSRVFCSTTVWRHRFISAQPFLLSRSHICTWLLEKPKLWLWMPKTGRSWVTIVDDPIPLGWTGYNLCRN